MKLLDPSQLICSLIFDILWRMRSYKTENGAIVKKEESLTRPQLSKRSSTYIDADGKTVSTNEVTDENGLQVNGLQAETIKYPTNLIPM